MNLPIFAMELSRDRMNPQHLTRAQIQGFTYDPAGAVKAGYLDQVTAPEQVETQALAIAGQLTALPGKAYAWNKSAVRRATLDSIRASLGAHHKL